MRRDFSTLYIFLYNLTNCRKALETAMKTTKMIAFFFSMTLALSALSGCALSFEPASTARQIDSGVASVGNDQGDAGEKEADAEMVSVDATNNDLGPADAGLPVDAVADATVAPDVQPDAGFADATPVDQGFPMVDAGFRDAEGRDIGNPDAFVPDSGPRDTGIHPDAASPPRDAGSPDAFVVDTGPRDTGIHPDAAPPPDTGIHPDAMIPDIGFNPDAFVPDSGPRDNGVHPDAAPPPDAGFPDMGFADAGFLDSGIHPDAMIPDSGISVPTFVPINIPAGGATFTMGSPPSEPTRASDETEHSVRLTRSFLISQTPVTERHWEELMGTRPSVTGDSRPVVRVSFWDGMAYANVLSRIEGREECYNLSACTGVAGDQAMQFSCSSWSFNTSVYGCGGYRLPTEAEWEYAARAGTTTTWWFGQLPTMAPPANCSDVRMTNGQMISNYIWFCASAPFAEPQPVVPCGRPLSPFGVCDMSGNVWEWTVDAYGVYPTGLSVDPVNATTTGDRSLRGGAFNVPLESIRTARRINVSQSGRFPDWGLRLVRTQ